VKKRYLNQKRVYTHRYVAISIPSKLHGLLQPFFGKDLQITEDAHANSLTVTLTPKQQPAKAFLHVENTLARELQDPRLMNINFHSFRHWKATMLYHQTHDPYYVKDFLGHKSLQNTEIYITVERTVFGEGANDEFTVKVAERPEEIKQLLEVGFEYVCQKDSLIFLRKRK
jgi:integrase